MERSSFRDPAGFVFHANGKLFRQVNNSFKSNYDLLQRSGLYRKLTSDRTFLPHKEVSREFARSGDAYKVIEPLRIPFVSYPYEWCFSQLKDAAQLTLKIQKMALEHGMTLRDASTYNIQFLDGKPILIDSLSLGAYEEGQPWSAYRQFCEHFIAPLALMSYVDVRLNNLLQLFPEGIPLEFTSRLLPPRSRFNIPILIHILLHDRAQRKYQGSVPKDKMVSKQSLYGIIDSLAAAVDGLRWDPSPTVWLNYYAKSESYSKKALQYKKRIVSRVLDRVRPKMIWDVGSSTGLFSQIAAEKHIQTVAMDNDPSAVETLYRSVRNSGERMILPLVVDIANPSPAIGWANAERQTLAERGSADVVMALALLHHLAIGHNIPFLLIAQFFKQIGQRLLIEFIPKEDPYAQKLLTVREDIFIDYNRQHFEQEFGRSFVIEEIVPIQGSLRVLYLMKPR